MYSQFSIFNFQFSIFNSQLLLSVVIFASLSITQRAWFCLRLSQKFLIPHYTLLPMVVIFASLSIILSPSAQGPLVQAELGPAFAYRKNYLLLVVIFALLSIT